MDNERLNHVAAEVTALRIMISAFAELYPDPILLRQSIERHAKTFESMLPTETEKQKGYIASLRRKLNTFSELI